MRFTVKPSEVILVVVAVAAAVGSVLFAIIFLLLMDRGQDFLTSQAAEVSTPEPAKPVQILKDNKELNPEAVQPLPTQAASPTETRTPLPTLYTFEEPTRENLSFPAAALPTEMSALSLPTAEIREPQPLTITHLIRPNESLYRIAQQYDVSVEAIKDLNNLVNPKVINPGRTLLIPSQDSGTPPPVSNPVASHTPITNKEGETSTSALVEPLPAFPAQSEDPIPSPQPSLTSEPVIQPTPTPALVILAAATPEAIAPATLPEPTLPAPDPLMPLYSINGLPLESITIMSPEVRQHVREVYDFGQSLGNNTHAFSKVGDSTSAHPYFLAHFDGNSFNLGPYGYLQPAINHFTGSFARQSVANRVGLHAWTATDPAWASNTICLPNESPVACEIRLHRPIIILIRLGSNDRGASSLFDSSMRQAVQTALDNGVIPVLGTKPDRFEGSSNLNNIMIRQIAADYRIPLWELDLAASTIPGRGLGTDNVHLTSLYPYDYGLPWALQRGHAVQNISALMTLGAILQELGLYPG